MEWRISTTDGPAGPFHQRVPDDDGGHQIWIHRTPGPALILGSTQPDELVRRPQAEAAGFEVCRRRSGGGLVHVDPETDCWIDVIVPRSSPLWLDDVGRAFHWLGEVWADALADLIAEPTTAGPVPLVHRSAGPRSSPSVWCFGDVGHGEVSLGGYKVVGLSQRRTRTWARLQALLLGAWPGDALLPYVDLDLLVRDHPDRYPDVESLRPGRLAAGFPPTIVPPDPSTVGDRFVAAAQAALRRFS